jgi:hypothetical protein
MALSRNGGCPNAISIGFWKNKMFAWVLWESSNRVHFLSPCCCWLDSSRVWSYVHMPIIFVPPEPTPAGENSDAIWCLQTAGLKWSEAIQLSYYVITMCSVRLQASGWKFAIEHIQLETGLAQSSKYNRHPMAPFFQGQSARQTAQGFHEISWCPWNCFRRKLRAWCSLKPLWTDISLQIVRRECPRLPGISTVPGDQKICW